MSGQSDLFGGLGQLPPARGVSALPLPAKPPVEHYPTPPTLEWAKLLTAYGPLPVILMPGRFMTGVILETLSVGLTGRWGIRNDGAIVSFPADGGSRARIVYLTFDKAREMHMGHPMLPLGPLGEDSGRYRFAEPGETTPIELELPR